MRMSTTKFVEMLDLAATLPSLYVMGGIGAPAGYGNNRDRFTNNYPYNKGRSAMIKNAPDNAFLFDCVCLGKAILWGWCGKTSAVYGGATYTSNGVPDFGTENAMSYCDNVSTDFSNIDIGEWLWLPGHVGYYVGNGKVIECTPMWSNGVQYTNITARKWQKHGKCIYIDYEEAKQMSKCPYCGHDLGTKPAKTTPTKSNDELAREVIQGKWGNGGDRKKRLTEAGYSYGDIQRKVDELLR